MTILIVIAILVFLIVVHELGHFAAAKLFGVRVEEFGIGYPPRALLLGKRRGTEYTLNWIPFGGFVRLWGEHPEELGAPKGSGALSGAPRYAQAIILFSGVAMNAVAAWILFSGSLFAGVPQVVEPTLASGAASLYVSEVLQGSPASAAGLQVGDEIVSVRDGEEEAALRPDALQEFTAERGGKDLSITYVRNGEAHAVDVYPAHAVIAEQADRPAIGLGLALVETKSLPLGESLVEGYRRTIYAFKTIGQGIVDMIDSAIHGNNALREVVGPVGLVSLVGDASKHGLGNVLSLAAFISVNLTLVNLLPIPALDGGRLAILGVEALLRRRAPRLAVQLVNALGVALIAFLMITVTYQDIGRLIS